MYRQNGLIAAIFLFYLLLQANFAIAEGGQDKRRGQILKFNGEVSVININGERRTVGKSQFIIREMDTIVTKKGSRAVVQFSDGTLSVLDQKSSLRIEKTSWFSHIGGKIYFTFKKVFGPPRKIQSKFATIGIRGTTFIVYDDENGEGIALQEGELEIESPEGEFEIHKQKVVDDFAAFKQQAKEKQETMKNEFSEYKKQITKDFVEYKKSFTLEANRVIRFDGKRVDETEMGDNVKAEFASFEEEAGEMLKQFREQSEQHNKDNAE